jgi:pyridoxamine 5'-phosphate oxidase
MQTTNNTDLEKEIWHQLLRASVDKHHEWRSPVLATQATNGWPDARTVILRGVDMDAKTLTFYTDKRSQKIAHLQANPHAILVFWSKRLNWQLRTKAVINIQKDGDLVQKTWQKVKQSPSAGDYLSVQAPGDYFDSSYTGKLLNEPHFAILIADIIEIDWLALNRNGHQRATINDTGTHYTVP